MTTPRIHLAILCVAAGCGVEAEPELRQGAPCPDVVMKEVNDAWIADTQDDPGNNKWARAVYFVGNQAAYEALGEPAYLEHALAWAESHDWRLNRGTDTRHADDHAAAQTYLALYALHPDPSRIADVAASIDDMVESDIRDDWWWIDAMFMAMPVFAELGEVSGDPRYVEAVREEYLDTRDRRGLFDPVAGLWFRDERFIYPRAKTPRGEKVFWSRGNGWVIASLARTLDHLPADSVLRPELEAMLQTMAAALVPLQRPDGFWGVSLHDRDNFPGPETSGTAFFTYAMAWGVNRGLLDRETYAPVIERAWRAMAEAAVHADGGLGWVQDVGEEPASSQPVQLASTADFGVGAFLLAGSQVRRLGFDLGCVGEPPLEVGR